MVNGIALISWRDDIGAYLVAQHPQVSKLDVKDVMSIYNVHRQNSLEPNFGSLSMKNLKVASFFTGLKTTKYLGPAPNYIVSLLLDRTENPADFRKILPNLTTNEIIPNFLEMLPEFLEKFKKLASDIVGIILIQKQSEGEKPFIVFQAFKKAVDLTSNMIREIWSSTTKNATDAKYSEYKEDKLKFANFYTGTPEKFVVTPGMIVSYIFEESSTPIKEYKKLVLDYSFDLLMKITAILTEGLNRVSEIELQNLEEKFIPAETQETSIETKVAEEAKLKEKLEKIELKTEVKKLETRLIETEEERQKSLMMLEGDKEAMEHLVEQITKFQEKIIDKTQELTFLENKVEEKDKHIRNLLKIIRSLRKYVSY
ncbi:MAG: hypothetical protein HWN67_13960 [Candidatus Helarchaeota archaeon]|nr:hypothetical protein [Candidatus Helarchaeota archaeon]